ncbi:MAG: hypothetical protein WHS86_00375 [Desulfosoma sp.]
MKRKFMAALALGVLVGLAGLAQAQKCTTIQDGTLYADDGSLVTVGFDDWGYNYQAHMFNGTYCDAYFDASWCQPYKDIELIMKWNDAWLSNKDCDGDGLLDRHYGYDSYKGSGAWLTNHQSGWVDVNGKLRKWTYFVKIVAVPSDAVLENGTWLSADGTEIGRQIWGDFAIIQEVYNDPAQGAHGLLYKSPVGPGLGMYGPHGQP